MKKRYYLLLCAVVLACAIVALVIRRSYIQNGTGIDRFNYIQAAVSGNIDLSRKDGKTKIASMVNSMVANSDIIVKCKYSGNREILPDGFYSNVKIEKVLKGNRALTGKTIYVIESIYTFESLKRVNGGSGNLPIKKNQDYLLLLVKRTVPYVKNPNDVRNHEYTIYKNWPYSEYRISGYNIGYYKNLNAYTPLGQLSSKYDLIAADKNAAYEYTALRNKLFAKFLT